MKMKSIPRNAQVVRSIIVFLVAFGLNQTGAFLSNTNSSLGWFRSLTFLIIAAVIFLFMRFGGSSFRRHGFVVPRNSGRLLALSLFLAFLYVFAVLFIPGGLSEFEALPSPINWDVLLTIGNVVLATIATVAVFQGYIQTNITDAYGFSGAAIVVAAMFTLYTLPVTLYLTLDPALLFRQVLLVVAQSVFLSLLFWETQTLLTPIVFTAAVTLLGTFTPLEAIATDYVTLFSIISYMVLMPIMHIFVEEVKQQNAKLSSTPILESQ